jgi:hypothetical protein
VLLSEILVTVYWFHIEGEDKTPRADHSDSMKKPLRKNSRNSILCWVQELGKLADSRTIKSRTSENGRPHPCSRQMVRHQIKLDGEPALIKAKPGILGV